MATLNVLGAGNTILFVSSGHSPEYFNHAVASLLLNGTVVQSISYPASQYAGSTSIDGQFTDLEYSTTYTVNVTVYQADGQISGSQSKNWTTDDPPVPVYTCSAQAGAASHFESVEVSPTTVQSGGTVTFRATPSDGYSFLLWSRTPIPTESSIESYKSVYQKVIYEDTTLYAFTTNAQHGATIYNGTIWEEYKATIYTENGWEDYDGTIYEEGGWPE